MYNSPLFFEKDYNASNLVKRNQAKMDYLKLEIENLQLQAKQNESLLQLGKLKSNLLGLPTSLPAQAQQNQQNQPKNNSNNTKLSLFGLEVPNQKDELNQDIDKFFSEISKNYSYNNNNINNFEGNFEEGYGTNCEFQWLDYVEHEMEKVLKYGGERQLVQQILKMKGDNEKKWQALGKQQKERADCFSRALLEQQIMEENIVFQEEIITDMEEKYQDLKRIFIDKEFAYSELHNNRIIESKSDKISTKNRLINSETEQQQLFSQDSDSYNTTFKKLQKQHYETRDYIQKLTEENENLELELYKLRCLTYSKPSIQTLKNSSFQEKEQNSFDKHLFVPSIKQVQKEEKQKTKKQQNEENEYHYQSEIWLQKQQQEKEIIKKRILEDQVQYLQRYNENLVSSNETLLSSSRKCCQSIQEYMGQLQYYKQYYLRCLSYVNREGVRVFNSSYIKNQHGVRKDVLLDNFTRFNNRMQKIDFNNNKEKNSLLYKNLEEKKNRSVSQNQFFSVMDNRSKVKINDLIKYNHQLEKWFMENLKIKRVKELKEQEELFSQIDPGNTFSEDRNDVSSSKKSLQIEKHYDNYFSGFKNKQQQYQDDKPRIYKKRSISDPIDYLVKGYLSQNNNKLEDLKKEEEFKKLQTNNNLVSHIFTNRDYLLEKLEKSQNGQQFIGLQKQQQQQQQQQQQLQQQQLNAQQVQQQEQDIKLVNSKYEATPRNNIQMTQNSEEWDLQEEVEELMEKQNQLIEQIGDNISSIDMGSILHLHQQQSNNQKNGLHFHGESVLNLFEKSNHLIRKQSQSQAQAQAQQQQQQQQQKEKKRNSKVK